MVLSGDDYATLGKVMIEANETIDDQDATITKQNSLIAQMKVFLFQYLNTMEGIFDSDESQLSVEHMEEYVSAAKFAMENFGRINNSIRQFEEAINKLPY